MMSINLSDIAILNVEGVDYCCIISGISRIDKEKHIIKYKNLLSHIKMGKEILTFGDMEIAKINFTAIRLLFF